MALAPPLMRALDTIGFERCTAVQTASLPHSLKGSDVTAQAQTGTGKTAAFLIAIIQHQLTRPLKLKKAGTPRAFILAPTRELAIQIATDARQLTEFTNLKTLAVFGGEAIEKQSEVLNEPVDIVVATPGRALDFCGRRLLHLQQTEQLVIDEADRMFSMGFIPDVRRLIRLTPYKERRHTMLFSATFTPEVLSLAEGCTLNSHHIVIKPERPAAQSVEQVVYMVTSDEKLTLLYNLIQSNDETRMLVFTNRRDTADYLHEHLKALSVPCALLSGAVKQQKRLSVLAGFKDGDIKVLVATDVAGRGLHIEGITHVINYNLPEQPEDYIHRIGRTGRAGAEGLSISFACEDDSFQIPQIEATIKEPFSCRYPDASLLQPLPTYKMTRQKSGRTPSGTGRRSRTGRRRTGTPGVSR